MSVTLVTNRLHAMQYDGTNGENLAAALGATFGSDDGNNVTFTLNGDPWSVAAGLWFVWASDGMMNMPYAVCSTADYQARYVPIAAA